MNSLQQLPAGTWQIDAAATTVTITVKKLGFLTVPATLDVVSGSIEIGDDHEVSAVEIAVDAASYASTNDKRNEHVVGSDFLDASEHPTITFQAGAVTATSAGYASKGTVTIKGKSSPIDVTISDVVANDTSGSFSATATVDRKALGIDKMPGFIIGTNLQLAVAASVTKNV
ncbi:MAG: YceI family protein [Ilumatobacter sp.]